MEAYYGLVGRLACAFEEYGLDYAFTGALAASFYGVPRTTVDVDVVVEVADGDLKGRLVEALKKARLVVGERAVERALKSGYRIATFEDSETAYRIDVILSEKKLDRTKGSIAGVETFFQSPEGLVLAKLRMIKATVPKERALKDEDDIRAILKFTKIDVEAVKKKARQDNTFSVFEALVT